MEVDAATSYINLAKTCRTSGDLEQAKEYQQRALDIYLDKLGPEHETIARSCDSLASICQDLGDFEQAKEYQQRSLDIHLHKLGAEHTTIAETYETVGCLYRALKDFEQAKEYYHRSLDNYLVQLGPEHITIARTYGSLASIYQELGDFEQAKEYQRRSRDISPDKLGPELDKVVGSQKAPGLTETDDPKQETQEKNDQLQGTENRQISEGHLQPEDPPSRHSYRDVGSSQMQGTENRQVSGGPFQNEEPPSRHSSFRDVGSSQLQGTENRKVSGVPFQNEEPPSRHGHRDHISLSKAPKEIQARGRKAILAYENALKTGKVKVYRARIMLIGQDRAGKTSMKSSFLGLPFDSEKQSTDGIEMDLSKFEIDVDQVKSWKRTDDNLGVSQFAHTLAGMVAEKLEQEETEMDTVQDEKMGQFGFNISEEPGKQGANMDPKPRDKPPIRQGTIDAKEGKERTKTPAIPQLEINPALPPEEFTDLLVQRLEGLNLESDTSAVEHHMILDLWDFAGQHLYYTCYPVFLSSRAVYLLVYNLNKGLNEVALPCFRRGFFNIPLKNSSRETNLENLLSWLVTVSSICSSQSETTEGEKKEADLPYSRPPVFIVGTHADKKQHKEIREMESQIKKEIFSKDYESHVILPFFSVDNTQGSSDEGVSKLQKKIIEVLKKEPYMGEEVPIRWFNFEKVVQGLVAADVYYLKLDQLKEITRKVCYIETERELVTMLNFYHDLGKIVKHHNTVILQAKWLIDVFKKLVTICPYDESESKKRKLWRQIEETGVLEMELVDHVFSTKFRHHKEDILDMMEHFGLIVKFTISPGNEIYFVPCQLQTPPDDLCKIEPLPSELCPLYLRFSGSFVPFGFFSQLVSRCVSWCSSAGFGLPNLFDGASRFLIGKEQNHQLILFCKKRFIKVTLKQIKQEELPLDETKLQDAAIKVRSFLEDTIGALSHEPSGLKNVAYELCIECPYCLEGQKTCHDHSQFPCDNEYCKCLLKVAADGSFEYCRKSYACEKPKFPQLQRWFPFKDMSQEEQSVYPVSKRKASCSDPQLPKRMKHTVVGESSRKRKNLEKHKVRRRDKVPREIKAQGPEAKLAYGNALKTGKVKVYRARIMLIGQDRAGKTSLKKSFLGLPFNPEEDSTDGIEVDPSKFEVDIDQVKNWKVTDKKLSVSQFALDLAKMVAKEIQERGKDEEVSQEDDEEDSDDDYEKARGKQREQKSKLDDYKSKQDDPDEDTNKQTKMGQSGLNSPGEPRLSKPPAVNSQMNQDTSRNASKETKAEAPVVELNIDPTSPPDEFTDYLDQLLKGLNLQTNATTVEHHMILDLWDFAGQQLYYASYPVFLSPRAVYMLVYDLSKGLNDPAQPYFKQGNRKIPLPNPNKETNVENLLSWLVSVSSICSSESEKAVKNQRHCRPPVFIVGTHADKQHQEDIDKIELQIKTEICENSEHVIRPIFSVDNTQGSSDRGVSALQKRVIEVLKQEPYMGEEIPIRWFNFEKVVKTLVAKKVYYLNMEELQTIIQKYCFIENKDEAATMLNFYHDLGVIVKHGSTVILRAEWLIKLFKQLITVRCFDDMEPRYCRLWKEMEKTGVLNMELVEHVFSEFCQQGVVKEDILEMMMKFGLIVQFALSPTEKKYFVPCQLRSPPDILCIKEPSPGDPCPLYLDFQGMGYVPHGLYLQLVSRCTEWCSTRGFKKPPKLYDGASLFFIGKELTHYMMLVCKKRFIKIVLKQIRQNDGSTYEPVSGKETPILVRTSLNEMMQNLPETLPWFKKVAYELCVNCPYCLKVQKPCDNHGEFPCHKERCLCLLTVAPDGSCEYCTESQLDELLPLPELKRWFSSGSEDSSIKDTSEEEVETRIVSQKRLPTSIPQFHDQKGYQVKKGTPSDEDLEELSQRIGKSWKPLGRRLQFTEAEITTFHKENPDEYSEKAYQMLLRWKSRDGKDATYQVLYDALDHKLVKGKRLGEEMCCD